MHSDPFDTKGDSRDFQRSHMSNRSTTYGGYAAGGVNGPP